MHKSQNDKYGRPSGFKTTYNKINITINTNFFKILPIVINVIFIVIFIILYYYFIVVVNNNTSDFSPEVTVRRLSALSDE